MIHDSVQTSLGELIGAFYDEFLSAFGDEGIAAALTAQAVSDLLHSADTRAEGDTLLAA